MATKFKRGKFWTIKTKNAAGEWVNISCGVNASATDAEIIRKNYDAIELNQKHNKQIRKVSKPLLAAIEDFRDNVLPRSIVGGDKATSSVRRDKTVINNFLRWIDTEKITIEYDKTGSIQEYFDFLALKNKSQKTRREERRILNKFFEWSIENHYTNNNPVTDIVRFKRSNKKPRFFTYDELKVIFSRAKSPYLDIFKFLYLTGLRVGELCNLKKSDYIQPKKQLLLRVLDGNKTKREEIVFLNRDANAIVEKQLSNPEIIAAKGFEEYLFLNKDGKQLDDANVYRALKRILDNKEVNIKDASTHTFRHTCASHLVIKGISLYVVKEILRHASIKETEVYAHLSNEAVSSAVEHLTI